MAEVGQLALLVLKGYVIYSGGLLLLFTPFLIWATLSPTNRQQRLRTMTMRSNMTRRERKEYFSRHFKGD